MLRTLPDPPGLEIYERFNFAINFEAKDRNIEISKIVDTSGPKNWTFQKFPPLIFFNPQGPWGYLIHPWGPQGFKKPG